MSARRPDVSVVIPTRGRPASLERAVRSVFAQEGLAKTAVELVVVDNHAGADAKALVGRLAKPAPFPVVYVCEPTPGVASARNTGVAKARAPLIAFLDDDEEASPGWLAALLDAQARFDADAVFGEVRGCAPESVRRHRAYFERFFSRLGPAEAGVIKGYYGCGDSLVRRAALPDPAAPFAVSQNHRGGEDDILFHAMKERGARFAWAPAAWVWEHPDPKRLTLAYALRRAFGYGQGPSYACAARNPPDWRGAAYWMLVGLGQALVFGAVAAAKWLSGSPDRAFALDRAVRGLGKVLWFRPFYLKLYGLPTD